MWRLNNLPQVTQLVSSRARIWPRWSDRPESTLSETRVHPPSQVLPNTNLVLWWFLPIHRSFPALFLRPETFPVRCAMLQAAMWQPLHRLALLSFIHVLTDFIQRFPCFSGGGYLCLSLLLPSIWLDLVKRSFLTFPSRSKDKWRNHTELLSIHRKLCRT